MTTFREVGLRDGLQLVGEWPSTEAKMRWIELEYAAGVRHFEVGSFLPINRFPQFADTRELLQLAAKLDDIVLAVLAVNKRGAIDALQTGADEIIFVLSASDEHSCRNAGRSSEAILSDLQDVLRSRDQSEARPAIIVAISMAFGCSISGSVAESHVLALATQAVESGADSVGLADTVGVAGPRQVTSLIHSVRQALPGIPLGIHLHDSFGTGLANAAAALDAGIESIDASLGGLGGCPFSPGATGNIAMEDLAYLAATEGIANVPDLGKLLLAKNFVQTQIGSEAFGGHLEEHRLKVAQKVHQC